MARFRPSELATYLESLGAHPKRTLSQNFLIDGNILDKIVKAAEVKPGDFVVEIGPGPGALTEKLVQAGAHVLAIELDTTLAQALKESFPEVEVICQDVLTFDFKDALQGKPKVKIVANLPYHLTTPILEKIAGLQEYVESATLMVQEEVARKFVAPSHIFIHYYFQPHYCFKVSPKCFYPAPKVYSAVIRLDFLQRYPVDDPERFFTLVNAANLHRRKMVKVTLRAYYPQEVIERALLSCRISPNARPEELTIVEWVKFSQALK